MNFLEYLNNEYLKKGVAEGTGKSQIKDLSQVKEDMLGPADSSGTIIVNPESPGQIMQTPDSIVTGMDTMSLAGPGKKKRSSKKKKSKGSPDRVGSFLDFVSRKR